MPHRHELPAFALALAVLVGGFFADSLFGGKVLSPADVVFAQASFQDVHGAGYEPANRLLIDPVLQFQPWLEFSRSMLRKGRLPLWNSLVGCGAPHLANGQSAVFDPFHLIAYLGRLPDALAWMAAARLWVAGLGMFLLAKGWALGRWGRWFAGLAFPFCGFLIVWLQFPVTSVAVWFPWLLLATDRVFDHPRPRTVGVLALIAGFVVLGGHVQTSAHVLIASGLYALWRWWTDRNESGRRTGQCPLRGWMLGMSLGLALAAIEIIPLGFYLSRSPVWTDRVAERPSVWAIAPPRLLDAACTALPYLFGSQRRGHPNLAKALGVHNLNESAGGFAGLATLIWLAPLALACWRKEPRVRFLAGLTVLGALGAFGLPPLANLLRAVPVLDVIDHRRLTLWLAFGLVLLGGIGLDELHRTPQGLVWSRLAQAWCLLAVILAIAAVGVRFAEPAIRAKAETHYSRAAAETPGADPIAYQARAEHQTSLALRFLPRYTLISAAHLTFLAALVLALRRSWLSVNAARGAMLGLTLLDLFGFGLGLNPAIDPRDQKPESAVIAYLRRVAAPPARILAVGAELPPNIAMRYGLADVRNYDSIELVRNLAWFAPLYEPEPGRPIHTSRRTITWEGVNRARAQLRLANVTAVVGASPPPAGLFERVEQVGAVWVVRLVGSKFTSFEPGHGEICIDALPNLDDRRIVPETFDPGWTAKVDGRAAAVVPYLGTFLSVPLVPGAKVVTLRYSPAEVWVAAVISLTTLVVIALAMADVGSTRLARKIKPKGLDGGASSG
ncbi:MAG: hypothetical protein ABI353_09685 [Isosphaeraceae bacterium]